MKKKVLTIVLIIVFVAILILLNIFLNKQNEQKISNKVESEEREENKVEVLKVTSKNFEEEVLQSEKTVLVDLYADWCGPCKMLAPVMEEIANENEDIKVVKVNVDEAQDLAVKYDVMSIPTSVVIKNGQEVDRIVGLTGKETILNMVK